MDETNFAHFDELNRQSQSTANVYTILDSRKETPKTSSRLTADDNYIKKSTAYRIIALIVNVATITCIGCGVLVYLVTREDRVCKMVHPESSAIPQKQDRTSTMFENDWQEKGPTKVTLRPATDVTEALSTVTISTGRLGCPDNWLTYGQTCYFFSNHSVTWLAAMIRCQKQGGYLAEINTAAEDQFLRTHATQISSIECYQTTSREYRGLQNTTFDGHVCQRWDSQQPHKHSRNNTERFPDTSVADAANYCRDPDGEGYPWCYTTDPNVRWQHCGIYKCHGGNYWIGMVALEGKWKWMTKQTKLDKGYTNWGKDEPSKGNCGSFMGALDFAWNGQSCELPAMYLCEN